MNSVLKNRACGRLPGWLSGSRRVWLHDGSPARDVARSVVVGGASVPAPHTLEIVAGATVLLIDVAALVALPRCVPWVHQCHPHAREGRLVGHELAEVVERPRPQV